MKRLVQCCEERVAMSATIKIHTTECSQNTLHAHFIVKLAWSGFSGLMIDRLGLLKWSSHLDLLYTNTASGRTVFHIIPLKRAPSPNALANYFNNSWQLVSVQLEKIKYGALPKTLSRINDCDFCKCMNNYLLIINWGVTERLVFRLKSSINDTNNNK